MKRLVAVEAVVLIFLVLIGFSGARTAGALLLLCGAALFQGIFIAAVYRLLRSQWREYHRKDKE